jgi:hypothetical protein
MTDEPKNANNAAAKRGIVRVAPGKLLEITDVDSSPGPGATQSNRVQKCLATLSAYRTAAKQLVEGKYAATAAYAPSSMRVACNTFAIFCSNGLIIRHDPVPKGGAPAQIRCGEVSESLAELSPKLTDNVVHFPANPVGFVPAGDWPKFELSITGPTGEKRPVGTVNVLVYASPELPKDYVQPPPPSRPVCLTSIDAEGEFVIEGVSGANEEQLDETKTDVDHFIIRSRMRLPVAWQALEIYPVIDDGYWRPEYAPIWAELDLLAIIAERNLRDTGFKALDGRADARRRYAGLLGEFDELLKGPEEPVHQFLKSHPELLCPTFDKFWSKLPFGRRVSDFVFKSAHNDYELVEIEAPIRELFRKDGQQREELTHAINQIQDWLAYLGDNKALVEAELGLTGISISPRMLVVIGRSADLTEENRKKLTVIQASIPKLRILTYDDLIANTRANLERILGPLTFGAQGAEFYWFKQAEGVKPL